MSSKCRRWKQSMDSVSPSFVTPASSLFIHAVLIVVFGVTEEAMENEIR